MGGKVQFMTISRAMTFSRYGRSYHLRIETSEDLQRAVELDEAHWVATNAPISTINCDDAFLKVLDSDQNGRITAGEVKSAIRWILEVLCDRRGLDAKSDSISLEAISTDTESGRRIHQTVRRLLDRPDHPETEALTLSEVQQVKAHVESMPVSAAGVVLPEAATDQQTRQFITDVIAVTGGAVHPSGARGLSEAQLEEFLTGAAAHLDWLETGEIPQGQETTSIMPMGRQTSLAFEILTVFRPKMDQYFAQCEAAALDERFVQRMGWTGDELQDLDFDDPKVIEDVLKKAPLAKPRPERQLRFDETVNPYYAELLDRFRVEVCEPLLGPVGQTLSGGQWLEIKSAFADHQGWCDARVDGAFDTIDCEQLRRYLDERFVAAVRSLIADRTEAAFVLDNICLTEKLLLYQINLIDLANNFVSFPHLYDASRRAMFEMGTLVMDGRRFNLAVRVDDRPSHLEVARSSNMYVLYVQITPGAGRDSYEVAIPVTSGGRGNLCLQKRGVFYDLAGFECDARVVHIITNPISIGEALVSPFQRLGRLVTGKIESFASAAEKKLDTTASAAMTRVAAAPPTQPSTGLAVGGILMGAGVAIAALGSAIAYIAKSLTEASWLAIIVVVLGAVLLVALPTAIVAFLKLRSRNLSAILEGSGWAINAPMRLRRNQRRLFTHRPKYPKGAGGIHGLVWLLVAGALLVILAVLGMRLLQTRFGVPSLSQTRPASSRPAPGK